MWDSILEIIKLASKIFANYREDKLQDAKNKYFKIRTGYELKKDKRSRTALDLLKLRTEPKKAGDKLP